MLQILHRIAQDVNSARSLDQALEIIVDQVANSTRVDVCSIYLADPETSVYTLMATRGLNRQAVGRVHLESDEGLVGLVGERREPINLEDADQHPRFRYFPETGEERLHSFLGVPIIHFRRLLGVLVVQQTSRRRFSEEEVAFVVTIAAQLAGAIAHGEATGNVGDVTNRALPRRGLSGVPGAPGVVIGTAMVAYSPANLFTIPDRRIDDPERETRRFLTAVNGVKQDVQALAERLAASMPSEELQIFEVYLRMLDSSSLIEPTLEAIRAGNWACGALRETVSRQVKHFDDMTDSYLRERGEDVRDIGRRILMRLQAHGEDDRSAPLGTILVGEEITASQLAEVPLDRLAGVVSLRGSGNSHTAILARALNVPAVMGVAELPIGRIDGRELVVDGYAGRVYIEPSRETRAEFQRLLEEDQALSKELDALRELPAQTLCGHRIGLYANTGLIADINQSLASSCDGIGLHRTEFPFLARERFPGEDEQTVAYQQLLAAFHPRKVVLRTLDVGGDKPLPYFPVKEENPFLGWRGIRMTLDHPEIFLTQLRAMLRANTGLGNLQILFPMISQVSEYDEALALLSQAVSELREEGIDVLEPETGVMIEVPSAVYQADALTRRADFLSVGSNDLTQYLLAVDRNNARVASLYDELHPAVIHAIARITEAAHAGGKPVTVCGSMAGDPVAALLLLGLGVDGLSMSISSLLRIKWVIRSFGYAHAAEIAHQALSFETVTEVRSHLSLALDGAGLSGLIRAGR